MAGKEEISRRDFLKAVPEHFARGVRTFMQEYRGFSGGKGETPELNTVASEGKRAAVVDIKRCLAWGEFNCQFCYLACPLREKAITMCDCKPVVNASSCDGCGMCVVACQTINDLPAIKIIHEGVSPPTQNTDRMIKTGKESTYV